MRHSLNSARAPPRRASIHQPYGHLSIDGNALLKLISRGAL